MTARTSSLDLAVVGNSRVGALIDSEASVVWMCVPRFDGDPVFCALLDDGSDGGRFDIVLQDCVSISQAYERNTAILRTEMTDSAGGRIELIDFVPRFHQHGRTFAPVMLVRIARRLEGRPRIRVRFDPRCDYGANRPKTSFGSHHIRAEVPSYGIRLTTDAPITHVLESRSVLVDSSLTFILGPDETLQDNPLEAGRRLYEETSRYWRRWVRNLAVPLEWQEAVIRAAITLKLNTFDDTGGIVAALTTSVPEAPHTQRTWDYRYCWLRDAYFVLNALSRLGATGSLERYLRYIENIVAGARDGSLQPVYALNTASELEELPAGALSGYRGMGPVRVGNLAYKQAQHDVYGSAILGVTHAFFDARLERPGDVELFRQLETMGHQAFACHALPDAGIWEYRGRQEVHTFSSLMCWAACDRLARIARRLLLSDRAGFWADRAAAIHDRISREAWNPEMRSFVSTFGGKALDASLLLMTELDFLPTSDPRLRGTVAAVESQLRRGDFLMRYDVADDFGKPETAFLVCTFWWIQALAALGERDRAREEFERILACRNRFGLLSEDIDVATHELWGNFPQTYSMVGIIMCAKRLSRSWDEAF
jgi:GH15 family glucan-1,4-alpha-glucosidase